MEETDFCDVTLASENQQLRAHNVILAASSPKLRSILLHNPHPNPVIYLIGIKSSIMVDIMKFIYQGEVDIRPDQVRTFLPVAEELQERGLTDPPEGGQTREEITRNNNTSSSKTNEKVTSTRQYTGEYVESEDEEVKQKMENIINGDEDVEEEFLEFDEEEDITQ